MFENNTYDNFIKLVRNVFIDTKEELDNLNLDAIYSLAKYHSLEFVIYQGLKNYDISDISKEFTNTAKVNAYKTVIQDAELDLVCSKFSENEMYYMPLKGSLLHKMYPMQEYRNMADLDILVKEEDMKKAGNILKDLGYSVNHLGGNHDSYKKEPYMNIEIHRALIDEYYDTASYYKNIWNENKLFCQDEDKFHYYFKDEDFYIFLVAHAGKHFSHGGTGFRTIIDFYIYLKNRNLDFEYINNELDKLKLRKFNDILLESVDYIFYNKETARIDDVKYFIIYILSSGTYGNTLNDNAKGVTQTNSKRKLVFRKLFPPYKVMVRRNPSLKKVPILLPWFWFTRLIRGLFHFKEHKKTYDTINNIDENDLNRVNKIIEITGVE